MLVLGVAGSAAKSHRTRALVELALAGAAELDDVQTELVDLADTVVDFPDGRPMEAYSEATRHVLDLVQQAGAYIFGTPMYRGGMTGALKNLIDVIPKEHVVGKAAGLVATGASQHHYLGVELGLRTAMSFFQVHTVPAILYGATFQLVDGRPDDEALVAQALQLGRDTVLLARGTAGQALGPKLF
ncbi:MAG TPA: NAD(P)H-dependent oxidoreductase [Chloroflexota bacterium]|nr:NAD(P)H-dependent oxidoreductase [Chloroflexota bacterium]